LRSAGDDWRSSSFHRREPPWLNRLQRCRATLTYVGYAYGSYLGVTYANLFPNNFRALVVDGVLDPVAWSTGAPGQASTTPFSTRLRGDSRGPVNGTAAAVGERGAGRAKNPRFGIGNPATGLAVFMRVGGPGTPTFASLLAARFLPFIVYNDPTYDPAAYDIEIDLRTVVDAMEHTYDFSPNTTALAGYLRSGKKIIIWHGTEDMLVSHIDTIQAYETMTRQAGRDSENARFYALPGVQHCGGGPGTNRFDMIAAITDWVENGSAPQTPIASRSDAAGNLLFTRPLCEFPGYPRYAGQGDPNDASSFECVTLLAL
jgi:pimeloyl-ACP methyl ester carboxylesterase